MSKLRLGTCSWKYSSWAGIIYSGAKEINYLEEYSRHFSTVEIDQWFYSLFADKVTLPKEKDVLAYASSVPETFKFTIKVPNSLTLTHHYNWEKNGPLTPNTYFLNEELFAAFLEKLEPMKDKIGMLMFEFEYLNKQKMSGLTEFIDKFSSFLTKVERKYAIGIETRNPNYLRRQYFEFLDKEKLSPVFLQGYYAPFICGTYDRFKQLVNTTTVIRLHGPDRAGIEAQTKNIWDKIIEPKDDELKKILSMVQSLLKKEVDVYLNVNNHYEGSAPLTVKKIESMLALIESKKTGSA